MATLTVKKIDNPIIVISGDHGTGKSYIHKRISKYIQSSVSLNKFDFITRKLLYIMNIHPLQIGYVLIDNDVIDRKLYQSDAKMSYLRDMIASDRMVSKISTLYFIEHIMGIAPTLYNATDIDVIRLTLDELYSAKNEPILKGKFYDLTKFIFNTVIVKGFRWNIKENVFKYLDSRFPDFKTIYDDYQKRVVYYAYDVNEILYFKEQYGAQCIFITMKGHLQSQLLLKNRRYESADEIITHEQKENVQLMRNVSDFVIENNLEMDQKLINKIMGAINI